MFDLLWDLHQQSRINELESKVGRGSDINQDASSRVVALEQQVEKLTMVTMAMWQLLIEKTPLTEEDLKNKVNEIDLMDGKLDGKIRQSVQNCSQCGRVLSRKHRKCLYCGHDMSNEGTAFDNLIK